MSWLGRASRTEFLIVGLGNPGEKYARTRHNIGFQCLGVLAKRHRLDFDKKKSRARIAQGEIAGRSVVLARPYTYMNLSGLAVSGLCRWLNLPAERILVVYDDLDLPMGTLRLRGKGSGAGHRGMQSIIESLRTQDFPRLRIGIGRPADPDEDPIEYVLRPFTRPQQAILGPALERAADAVECFLGDGLDLAMSRFNRPAELPD